MLKDAASSKEEVSHEFSNRFGALDVEDLDGSLRITTADVFISDSKPTKGHSIDIHELEDQYEIDHALIIFCFFENLH